MKKTEKLENVHYEIRGRVMDEMVKMENRGREIIKLNIGNPAVFGFKAPTNVVNCINLHQSQGYSNSKGLLDARVAISEYCSKKKFSVKPNDVYIGNGVSELIIMSMQAFLNNDDEILIPSPDYPLWTAAATLAGGRVIHYLCDEDNEWYPNINDIKSKISTRTKGILIINPNNPTGAVYPRKILKEIVSIAEENDLVIFSDEIYDRLLMDGVRHISIASLTKKVPVITYNGLSKSHMLCGMRVGWLSISGNKKSIKGFIEGLNLLSSMRLCSNVPAQFAIREALNDDSYKELLKKGGRIYEQREAIYNGLRKIPGISVVKPKAAFYIFPKIDIKKYHIRSDERFALDLLKKEGVLIVQGSGFNYKFPDHFRVVYLADVKILDTAISKIKHFLKEKNK